MREVIIYLSACVLLLVAVNTAVAYPVKMPGDWREGSITMQSGDRYRKFGIYMFVPHDEDYQRDAPVPYNGFGGPSSNHGDEATSGGSLNQSSGGVAPRHQWMVSKQQTFSRKPIGRMYVTVRRPPPVPAATITIVRN